MPTTLHHSMVCLRCCQESPRDPAGRIETELTCVCLESRMVEIIGLAAAALASAATWVNAIEGPKRSRRENVLNR
jgi:hypothetical protein